MVPLNCKYNLVSVDSNDHTLHIIAHRQHSLLETQLTDRFNLTNYMYYIIEDQTFYMTNVYLLHEFPIIVLVSLVSYRLIHCNCDHCYSE